MPQKKTSITSYRDSVTNKLQFEFLVNWMSDHSDFVIGFSRLTLPDRPSHAAIKTLKDELVAGLNKLGPPHKPTGKWRKVWADYRNGIKKKFLEHTNKERIHTFTDLELRVVKLLNLEFNYNNCLEHQKRGRSESPMERLAKRRKVVSATPSSEEDEDVEEIVAHVVGDAADGDADDDATKARDVTEAKSKSRKLIAECPKAINRGIAAVQLDYNEKESLPMQRLELKLEEINRNVLRGISILEQNNTFLKFLIQSNVSKAEQIDSEASE